MKKKKEECSRFDRTFEMIGSLESCFRENTITRQLGNRSLRNTKPTCATGVRHKPLVRTLYVMSCDSIPCQYGILHFLRTLNLIERERVL